ncbi:SIMPL domain-containing protein [Chamaesiphon sp.]|uniref:SIMPL domain-containing protein n=1 Tax=Chamaesiphon sp. TaxID=2814140 RepID=UPI003592E88D
MARIQQLLHLSTGQISASKWWNISHPHWRANTKPALALLLTASFVLTAGIAPGATQERKPPRTLTASGRGIVTIPTTLSQIRLAIEVSAKTPTAAQQAAATRSTRVIDYLKTQRVDKLQTTGINLNPTYTYPPNSTPQLTGYTANNSISFRVTTDRAGAILDAAVKNGATRIDGVSFVASEQAISTAQIQALKQATQDAQRQADAVLDSLNFKRREVIGIQINSNSTPAPIPLAQDMTRQRLVTAATTPVIGGEQQVEASVTLDIGY